MLTDNRELTTDNKKSSPFGELFLAKLWCPRPDSNRHGFLHTPLKRARLPIPPLGQAEKNDYRFAGAGAVGAADSFMTDARGRA